MEYYRAAPVAVAPRDGGVENAAFAGGLENAGGLEKGGGLERGGGLAKV